MQVSVDVSAVNSTLKATQSISLQSTVPDVVLYENNPLLGVVYEKAITGTFKLERPQVDFEGIPYFFSSSKKDDATLSYKWYINGAEVMSKSPNENYMVLQNNKNLEGTAVVNVSLSHANNILQNAKASLGLDFKKVDNASNGEFNF